MLDNEEAKKDYRARIYDNKTSMSYVVADIAKTTAEVEHMCENWPKNIWEPKMREFRSKFTDADDDASDVFYADVARRYKARLHDEMRELEDELDYARTKREEREITGEMQKINRRYKVIDEYVNCARRVEAAAPNVKDVKSMRKRIAGLCKRRDMLANEYTYLTRTLNSLEEPDVPEHPRYLHY
jgi:hypothetical protein